MAFFALLSYLALFEVAPKLPFIWLFSDLFSGKKTGWRKYERKYKQEWEEQFSWVERAPDQNEMAFCIMCRDVLEPRYNGLVKHEATVKHKARERGEPLPPGQLAATEAFLSAGGRRYRTVWETDFPWVRRAPGDNQSQNAYCTVCHEILLPKYNSLLKHQATIKHQANLESGSSYAKLQASPQVANAYFREEWKESYPWVTVDPSGNPGLAYCTVCCKSLTAKKYILSMHQQKAKHIKRAGLTPDEVSELVKRQAIMAKEEAKDGLNRKMYERKYRPAWEREFPFISKAPDGSEYAYCKLCRDYLAPKVNDIRKHMYTMKHRKRAIASGLNVKQESVTLVAGSQGQNEGGGLKVVQVPGSNEFTVVPMDHTGHMTTEMINVIDAPPPQEGVVIAVPGSVGALDPDTMDTTTLLSQENPGMIYHRSMLQEGLRECFKAELHSDIKMITNDGGEATVHQLVLAASSPLLRKAILNIDPAGRASDEPLTILLPDFSTDDLNTLLPWLYGDGSDEQQPDFELVLAMGIGQPQTFTKLPEGIESAQELKYHYAAAANAAAAARMQEYKTEMDPRLNPMDANSLFAVKDWNQPDDSESDDDDDYLDGPVHKLPRGRGRRRRYVQTDNGWECVECGLAMSKREYMRGHYEECMGGGKVLQNVPKDLVIVGSEKGGIKKRKAEEGGEGEEDEEVIDKKAKIEDEDVLKCFGCKHVYRTLVEMRAHLAAYDKCSNSTWVCDECPRTFGAERSLRIHTLQIHQAELICDKCAKNFGTDHKKFLRHLQRAHVSEEKKKDRMYKCGECARSFDYEKNLERHLAKHKEGTLKEGDTEQQKEFVCDQCGKIYGNYKSWFYHVKSHSVIYQCQTVKTLLRKLSYPLMEFPFFSVRGDSKRLEASSITWPCILASQPFTVASVAKPSSPGTSYCFIKNQGIQTKGLMLANGAAKDFCSLTNWLSTEEECTLAKSPSSATCAIKDSQTRGTAIILLSMLGESKVIFAFFSVRCPTIVNDMLESSPRHLG